MLATTIDEVVNHLDEIIIWAQTNESCLGYFAALYRKVTLEVKQKIQDGYFEDNARMEQLDVVFANRYLAAYVDYQAGKPVTASWQIAFNTAPRWRPIVMQHLLLGMNAHINLDLGIAAAQVAPDSSLADLQNDFKKINSILASLTDEVKTELSQVWSTLTLLDRAAGEADDAIINFSMTTARDEAWNFAQILARLDEADQHSFIHKHDQEIANLGKLIAHPPFLTRLILLVIRLRERGDIPKIIEILT